MLETRSDAHRYVSLDIVRGLAALSVVFWHWQHFYFSAAQQRIDLPDPAMQPLYAIFWPLYRHGDLAVGLFFCLSGFVFFYLYADAVREHKIMAGRFALLRFSRLYPLHLLTLLTVAALQPIYFRQHGTDFVYLVNDLRQFALHLLLVNNWPINFYLSFNGPVWSVSVEVLLYLVFFALCRAGFTSPIHLAVLSAAGSILTIKLTMVGIGLHLFFIGGLCHCIVARCGDGNGSAWLSPAACLAAGVLASIAAMAWTGSSALDTLIASVGFPALIVIMALTDRDIARVTRPIRWIGNISYASYLLHFPLQLALVVATFELGVTIDYAAPRTLIAFVGVLIALSLLSYYGFERPLQRRLRRGMRSPST